MTKTKLEIIGLYTPDHEGPFCTRDKRPVEILTKKDRDGNILGYVGDEKKLTDWCGNGQFDPTRMSDTEYDLMCARKAHVPREFWAVINWDGKILSTHKSYTEAKLSDDYEFPLQEIIYFREVTEGENS